jgi:hypothetical protein
MTTFLRSLKSATVYAVAFIIIYTGALWFTLFLLVTIQAFWKAFLTLFLVALALFCWEDFNLSARLKRAWNSRSHARRIKKYFDHAMNRYESVM